MTPTAQTAGNASIRLGPQRARARGPNPIQGNGLTFRRKRLGAVRPEKGYKEP